MSRRFLFLAAFALVVFVCASPTTICAQQDRFLVDENTVDAWVFQRFGNRQSATAALKSELDAKIRTAQAQYALTSHQTGQLRCAGHGDLKRFLDAAAMLRRSIAGKSVRQHEFQIAWEATHPLQERLQLGLYGNGSLFKKTLLGLLSEEQVAQLRAEQASRLQRRLRSLARSYLAQISPHVPMTAQQMEAVSELLVEDMNEIHERVPQESLLVQVAVSRLDKEKLTPLLDEKLVEFMMELKLQSAPLAAAWFDEDVDQ